LRCIERKPFPMMMVVILNYFLDYCENFNI